jgi:hypothetical protein
VQVVQMTNYELGIMFSLRDEVGVDQVICHSSMNSLRDDGSRGRRPWVIFFQVPVAIWLNAHEPTDAGR